MWSSMLCVFLALLIHITRVTVFLHFPIVRWTYHLAFFLRWWHVRQVLEVLSVKSLVFLISDYLKLDLIQALPGFVGIVTCNYISDRGPFQERFFHIIIQIGWKFHSAVIQVVMKQSVWNFAHGMTAVLSWYVHNFVATYPTMELQ